MSENALKRAQNVYDWVNIIPQYEQLWDHLDERRLAKQRSALSSKISHPVPERPDPFRFFANYPTNSLGFGDTIRIVGDDDVDCLMERYDEIVSLKMFSSYLPSVLAPSQVKNLLELPRPYHRALI